MDLGFPSLENPFRASTVPPIHGICIHDRTAAATEGKARKGSLDGYRTPRGLAILDALDNVAAQHSATCAQVALAWVAAQPGLTGPIASATSAAQVRDLVAAATLALTAQDLALLGAASA